MDEKFNTLLSIVIVPQIVSLIADKQELDEITALKKFYHSKVYELLSNEETKMWHYSPLALYTM